uniref:Bifunctional epoxide hydrolase 2 (inferred by orthology to a human protein) n=1 Tax=Strongyloides venezuelensis TaxID=75913 RepID=A0A0K0F0X7_STRVS
MNNIKVFMFDMGGVIMRYPNNDFVKNIQRPNENMKKLMEDLDLGIESIESIGKILEPTNPLKKLCNASLRDRDITKFHGGLIEDENVIKCLRILKDNGYKIALLTNNFYYDNTKTDSVIMKDLSYFDYVVESCRIGKRKPTKEFYEHALNLVQSPPDECVFVDDLKENCDGAEVVGIKSIHLKDGDSITTIKEIELITGLSIL